MDHPIDKYYQAKAEEKLQELMARADSKLQQRGISPLVSRTFMESKVVLGPSGEWEFELWVMGRPYSKIDSELNISTNANWDDKPRQNMTTKIIKFSFAAEDVKFEFAFEEGEKLYRQLEVFLGLLDQAKAEVRKLMDERECRIYEPGTSVPPQP